MTRRTLPIALFLLAVAGAWLLAAPRATSAEEEGAVHTIYLSIVGEGSTAKGWYKGSPPTGVLVQDALDTLSRDGYRVVSVSASSRPSVTVVSGGAPTTQFPEQTWLVMLQKR
jgi:hypothetical protein